MVKEGEFQPMTPAEILREEREMISLIQPRMPFLYVDSTVLLKYSLIAMLPDQKAFLLQQIDTLLDQEG